MHDDETPAVDDRLDCTGLRCPLPLLRTKQALHRMAAGRVLEVTATDPGSAHDIPAWLAQTGHRLLASEARDGFFRFRIARGE